MYSKTTLFSNILYCVVKVLLYDYFVRHNTIYCICSNKGYTSHGERNSISLKKKKLLLLLPQEAYSNSLAII